MHMLKLKLSGVLQNAHPEVAVSIKTQQAARRILNDILQKIIEMKEEGILDEKERDRLITVSPIILSIISIFLNNSIYDGWNIII